MDLKRVVDPVLLAELSKPMFHPIALLHVDWPVTPLRVHSGRGNLTWGGDLYKGLGKIGKVSVPGEDIGLVPGEAVLQLVGPIAEVLGDVAEQQARGRLVQIWVGCTTKAGGNVLIGDPFEAFAGAIDENNFELSPDRTAARLSLQVKSGPSARSSARIVHSDEAQQAAYPGDTLFRRVAHAAKWRTNPPQWPAP
ncbi:hypothetical protein TG4357_02650 [Thalassovita gelatinovora]|uniref:Uncharacterized protein n=1 Tax=Thalassovita gelatinovora TaxID=53501 RepID=A0A0P1FGL9_THAGE|nr:hypothetical protein [Thalassovita gelatinovora]QIZ79775.1 hypothetical protein HFZ77_04415 [Thalassovita gelatinovora]CUH66806.1 hypothetical protein TG4357_02650 [Thalassovita gelatinovora]SEQ43099.1 hypothetical protein SAMN04488043_105187 [Thalassovita gelatinovora]